ncbi:hypothetical protein [Pseudocolwellia agarivorans]|uniref:hypothetical protein n=1 Tax=Pseudocolwellia agarivorans TaxID=1911682 RepID=UPI003F882921
MNKNDENIELNEESVKIDPSISAEPSSQLELIKQWRTSLTCLMKDVKFDTRRLKEDSKLNSVLVGIEYLDKKNTLLDDDHDFQLTESGFAKYKAKHMLVFSYLSNLSKHDIEEIKTEFYFVDIIKHFEQQLIPSKWTHFLIHLLLIPLVCVIFVGIGALLVKQTQNNMVVNILFALCVFSQFSVIPELFKMVKKTVVSPFRFKVSLLAIHLLNALKKLFWICLLPYLIIKRVQPYWIDDVIIISLFIYFLVICSTDQSVESEVSNNASQKEAENV